MKTDYQLRQDVAAELAWDPSIRHEDIAVSAKEGVVTLGGTVDTYAQRYAAERAIERVAGVRGIANDIAVKLHKFNDRSDAEIAHAALTALKADVEVPDDKITVKVSKGWLSLQGKVNWQFQRNAAERAVRYLTGVKGIANNIAVDLNPIPSDITFRIEEALKRRAEIDASHISVEIKDHRVMLRGTVRSLAEKNDAKRAVWGAAGVNEVQDQLIIEPGVPAM
jgi:osmotically-inducible protein OsmY